MCVRERERERERREGWDSRSEEAQSERGELGEETRGARKQARRARKVTRRGGQGKEGKEGWQGRETDLQLDALRGTDDLKERLARASGIKACHKPPSELKASEIKAQSE